MPKIERVNKIVAAFCAEAIKEPLSFFSECDLQVRLSAMLRAQFDEKVSTGVHRGPNSKTTYKTGLVHNEYGALNSRRIDIVVFDKDKVGSINNHRLQCQDEYLKPDFGFELGTENVTDVGKHLKSDVAKLQDRVEKRGYVIHFYRDTTSADSGTKRRMKKEESIEKDFREHIENCKHDNKIVVLAFVLRLAHTHKKVWGKCEFYDRAEKGQRTNWKKTNVSKVGAEIARILEAPPNLASLLIENS